MRKGREASVDPFAVTRTVHWPGRLAGAKPPTGNWVSRQRDDEAGSCSYGAVAETAPPGSSHSTVSASEERTFLAVNRKNTWRVEAGNTVDGFVMAQESSLAADPNSAC